MYKAISYHTSFMAILKLMEYIFLDIIYFRTSVHNIITVFHSRTHHAAASISSRRHFHNSI